MLPSFQFYQVGQLSGEETLEQAESARRLRSYLQCCLEYCMRCSDLMIEMIEGLSVFARRNHGSQRVCCFTNGCIDIRRKLQWQRNKPPQLTRTQLALVIQLSSLSGYESYNSLAEFFEKVPDLKSAMPLGAKACTKYIQVHCTFVLVYLNSTICHIFAIL